MTEFAGRGDARRSMQLLWDRCPPPRRGPKPGLTPRAIAEAAVAIADRDGLDATTMRRVGEHLGTSVMSLYTYVPAKSELIDLMMDRVLGELAEAMPTAGEWRAGVEAWAAAQWAWYRRHPWVLQISTARPLLGPGELDVYEAQVRLFDGLGLSPVEVSKIAYAVATFISGAGKQVADTWAAAQVMGTTEDTWWSERSGLLEEMSADADWAQRWPTVTALGEAQAFDQADRSPDDPTPYLEHEALVAFEFGLARLLDGIASLIAARSR